MSDHKQCQVTSSRPSGQPQNKPDNGTSNAGDAVWTAGGSWQTTDTANIKPSPWKEARHPTLQLNYSLVQWKYTQQKTINQTKLNQASSSHMPCLFLFHAVSASMGHKTEWTEPERNITKHSSTEGSAGPALTNKHYNGCCKNTQEDHVYQTVCLCIRQHRKTVSKKDRKNGLLLVFD